MRKREDGSIEIHDSEVHSGARGIINVIEELIWTGWATMGPDYLASHIAVMDDVLPKITTKPVTDRKWKKTAMLATKPTQIQLFFRNYMPLRWKVTSRMVNLSLEILFIMLDGKYMSQLFEDKDLHGFCQGIYHPNLHLNQNQKNHKKTTARLFCGTLKSSRWRYCKSFT